MTRLQRHFTAALRRSQGRHGRRMRGVVVAMLGLGLFGAATGRSQTLPAEPAPATAPATASAPAGPTAAEVIATELIKIVGQSEPGTRRAAALRILQTQSPEGITSLLSVLSAPNNEAAKLAICQALADARLAPAELADPLLGLLQQKEPALRKAAAGALAGYSEPRVVQALAAYRSETENALLHATVSRLMGTLYERTPPEQRSALLQEWMVSELALERARTVELVHDTLRRRGAKPGEETLFLIRGLLDDPDATVRQRVVMLLRDLGLPADAAPIRAMLAGEPSPAVREEIYEALGKLGDLDGVEACIQGLKEPAERVAASAADALGTLCNRDATRRPAQLPAAVRALADRMAQPITTPVLRLDLIEAMADVADPSFASVFEKYAPDPSQDPAIRQAALRGIGRTGLKTLMPLLLDRLQADPEITVRETAATALGLVGDDRAVLDVLGARLNPVVEPAAAVQNQAWEAYTAVFLRLSEADQRAALEIWSVTETTQLRRRIELLAQLENDRATRGNNAAYLTDIRELLGDAHLIEGSWDEAAQAYERALVVLPAEQTDRADALLIKIAETHLAASQPARVAELADRVKTPITRESLGTRVQAFLLARAATEPENAVTWANQLLALQPPPFGEAWAGQISAWRQTLVVPPVEAPAPVPPASAPAPAEAAPATAPANAAAHVDAPSVTP